MFRRKVQPLDAVLNSFLRQEGLETPLLQKRLVDAWDTVAGQTVARYTKVRHIRNQPLILTITNPTFRADLSTFEREFLKTPHAAA